MDRFKGRKKPALPGQDPEWMATLKAWVHWVKLNPMDEHQEAMADAVNNLFSLLGTERAKSASRVESLEAENKKLRTRVEGMILSLQEHGQNIDVNFHIKWLSEALGSECNEQAKPSGGEGKP